MNISPALEVRCEAKCELCSKEGKLEEYLVPPKSEDVLENKVALCPTCLSQLSGNEDLNENHWRCLNESMWSPTPAVQVLAYRLLGELSTLDWAADLKAMMYLDEETQEWADLGVQGSVVHKDSNGNVLQAGDSVVLIQDLNVKGAGFTAKRGTAVRRIRLVHDNAEHIEGKVEGQQIVILTKYVKKS